MDGWNNYKLRDYDRGETFPIGGYLVKRWLLFTDYLCKENLYLISLYYKIKKYGWPHGGGWAEQKADIFNLVFILDEEIRKRDAERNRQD